MKLPNIKPITLNGFTLDIQEILTHEWDDISDAAQRLPHYAEWIHEQLHSLQDSKGQTERDLTVARAEAYFRLKNGGIERFGVSKATEAAVEAAIELDSEVQELSAKLITYEGWTRRLIRLSETLCRSMDMIRSSEATRRKIFASAEPE